MNCHPVHSVFFSPTGTTRSVVRSICRGTGRAAGLEINLHESVGGRMFFAEDDPVIVGMPVYGGRLPALAVERFAAVNGSKTPAVAVVVYGNRAYGDALLELCDRCAAQGFAVTGAAAFIGEHSFSSSRLPIASGRPDSADLQTAEGFGAKLADARQALDFAQLPGNRPYKPPMHPVGAAAETVPARCARCGLCATHCPAHAIRMDHGAPVTDPERCIWCAACVRNCPSGARNIVRPEILAIAERLYQTCQTRREPEQFPA